MTENQSQPQNTDQSSGHRGLLIGAIIAVILLIAVVFGVIIGMGKSEPATPVPPAETEAALATATLTPEMEETAEATATATEEAPAEPTAEPTAAPTEAPTPEPTEEPPAGLPPDPQEIAFQAEDGRALQGRYYPAAAPGAPVIVLMHWAPGDLEDWNEIAFWLQNRGLSGTSPNVGTQPWLDPTWFPAMPEGKSYAVFTFNFRDCSGGCASFDREGWRMDALAAMRTARSLEGVDPNRVTAIGASIGADGSVDSCGPLNAEAPNSCWGALSLSPGDYLNVPYADAVGILMQESPPKPVWCFYATGDGGAVQSCQSAGGDQYRTVEWDGNWHGMELIAPDRDPNAMQLILDFLATLGL